VLWFELQRTRLWAAQPQVVQCCIELPAGGSVGGRAALSLGHTRRRSSSLGGWRVNGSALEEGASVVQDGSSGQRH
jgi:hypothetical protein